MSASAPCGSFHAQQSNTTLTAPTSALLTASTNCDRAANEHVDWDDLCAGEEACRPRFDVDLGEADFSLEVRGC